MPTQTTTPRKFVTVEGERTFHVTNKVKQFMFTMPALHRRVEGTGQTKQNCSQETVGRKEDITITGRPVHQKNLQHKNNKMTPTNTLFNNSIIIDLNPLIKYVG